MFLKKAKIGDLLPPPVKVSHGEYSMILSSHDDNARPSKRLLDISIKAIIHAEKTDLSSVSKRLNHPPFYPDIWPGEHYRLLAGMIQTLQPKKVIEIGTATGLSSLSMIKYLPKKASLTTFDLIDWHEYPGSILTESDFTLGNFEQFTDDLSESASIVKHEKLLQEAEVIFIDATHDGDLEKTLFSQFKRIDFHKDPIIILDDIRVWTMLKMWREISDPKLDLTSFGHWSGTGLVEWTGSSG